MLAVESNQMTQDWKSLLLNCYLCCHHLFVPHSLFAQWQFDALVGAGQYERVDAARDLG
jgi:hypothetical protein